MGLNGNLYGKILPKKLHSFLKPMVDLLAGIPSIVYGFFGLVVIVPFVREHFKGNGNTYIYRIDPSWNHENIISVSESIRAVPEHYYEALALGATHAASVFKTVVPAAKSGIMAAVILGIGRAIGETMAVMVSRQPGAYSKQYI